MLHFAQLGLFLSLTWVLGRLFALVYAQLVGEVIAGMILVRFREEGGGWM